MLCCSMFWRHRAVGDVLLVGIPITAQDGDF